ncbi:cytochrome P450 [Morchella conica CCBAS932]|uniref:Cytochrome P450 n=1 Tax=Morchella conica CCBAS932 TaxID=1392247 RepID=A0A3N4L3V6_9PEZI|nr:cytochrome P450 [Morchella conica CCBAS932]
MESLHPSTSHLPDLSTLLLTLLLISLIILLFHLLPPTTTAPQVGRATGLFSFFSHYSSGQHWLSFSAALIASGISLHGAHGRPFKIRSYPRWITFLTSPALLSEARRLPLSILSYRETADEALQTEHTLCRGLMKRAWHMKPIQRDLPAKLARAMHEVHEEAVAAWGESTGVAGGGWVKMNPHRALVNVVSRATNRVLVGAELCRDAEFMAATTALATGIIATAGRLEMLPGFVRPVAAWWMRWGDRRLGAFLKYTDPIFAERRRRQGTWGMGEKPDDAFQWILEAAPKGASLRDMAFILIFLNLASIHTTAGTLTQVLFDLCVHPHYQPLLREEAEEALKDGLSGSALGRMKRLDSVIRETLRMSPTNVAVTPRKVITSHTFSDGTRVGRGSWVAEPVMHANRSGACYDRPDVYDGFRFVDMAGGRNQCVSTSVEFLSWGHGASACPGRFFAVAEMKIVLAIYSATMRLASSQGWSRGRRALRWEFSRFPIQVWS